MRYLLLLTLFATLISCSKDEFSNIEGSFLTINEDTRELINDGTDPDLRIDRYAEITDGNWYGLSGDVTRIGTEIYDPNNALIANFGNYNIEGDYLAVEFIVPNDFSEGDYVTLNESKLPSGSECLGDFWIQQEVRATSNGNQEITIKDKGNMYELTFSDITFDNGAVISGRVLINK